MTLPRPGDLADLLRLPSLLSVPGDVLLGSVVSGERRSSRHLAGLVASSSCLYAAGMALNDYADRDVDARERPKRPIPSGRVSARFALGFAATLTAASLVLAGAAGGRRSLTVAVPLAAAVWSYDLAANETRWGPAVMAACRSLDVMMGAGGLADRRAWPAAGVVGGHIAMITTVSRRETEGGTKTLALGALAGSAATTLAAAQLALEASEDAGILRRRIHGAVSLALLSVHAVEMVRAELEAARQPSPENLQKVVGAGVLGLMPLEAGMLAGAGKPGLAAVLATGWRLARRLARKRSVT